MSLHSQDSIEDSCVVHAYNANTESWRQEDPGGFLDSLSTWIVSFWCSIRPCLKTNKMEEDSESL